MRADRGLTWSAVAIGYALGLGALSAGLPAEASHAPADEGTTWIGAPMVALLLPTAVVVIDILLRGLYVRQPSSPPPRLAADLTPADIELPRAAAHWSSAGCASGDCAAVTPIANRDAIALYHAIMARLAIFIVGLHAAMLGLLLGLFSGRAWAAQLVPLMLGTAMIGVGNLLPLTRPNLAIGIRTRRTMTDRACWLRTHRLAGYVMVACGAVIVPAALAAPEPFGSRMILLAGPIACGSLCLLVRLAARQAHA